ncbi:MAG: FG-GAP repeat protein, partial [Coriobacteriia bacterium]
MRLFGRLLILPMLAIVLVLGGAQVALAATPAFQYGAQEMAKLSTAHGGPNDMLGWSVAVSGDTAVIGSPNDADMGSRSGAAFVYTRSNGVWTQQAKLHSSHPLADDQFGWSVAISGDTAVVSAYAESAGGVAQAGYVYVFTRSNGVWTQQAELANPSPVRYDFFGESVALSGDTVVIGMTQQNNNNGAAYVFTRSGTTWTQRAELTASDGASGDRFGGSVALSGDTVVIGARYANGGKGAAYVFTGSGATWTQQTKFIDSAGVSGDDFGVSVALSGDTVVIGAPIDDGVGLLTGSAFVFTRTGTAWTQRA